MALFKGAINFMRHVHFRTTQQRVHAEFCRGTSYLATAVYVTSLESEPADARVLINTRVQLWIFEDAKGTSLQIVSNAACAHSCLVSCNFRSIRRLDPMIRTFESNGTLEITRLANDLT